MTTRKLTEVNIMAYVNRERRHERVRGENDIKTGRLALQVISKKYKS